MDSAAHSLMGGPWASAERSPPLLGPWLQPTAWNACWWNLNVQLFHSGVHTANRREMGTALSHRLNLNRDDLGRNVAEPCREDSYAIGRASSGWDLLSHACEPGGREGMGPKPDRECGNLLWALHNADLIGGYSMTGGSCLASLLGDGDRALDFLNRLKRYLRPNTLCAELGTLPVMETPLHGAECGPATCPTATRPLRPSVQRFR